MPRFNFDDPRKSEVSHFQIAKCRDRLISTNAYKFCFGCRTNNFKAKRLLFWHQAFHLCPKKMILWNPFRNYIKISIRSDIRCLLLIWKSIWIRISELAISQFEIGNFRLVFLNPPPPFGNFPQIFAFFLWRLPQHKLINSWSCLQMSDWLFI